MSAASQKLPRLNDNNMVNRTDLHSPARRLRAQQQHRHPHHPPLQHHRLLVLHLHHQSLLVLPHLHHPSLLVLPHPHHPSLLVPPLHHQVMSQYQVHPHHLEQRAPMHPHHHQLEGEEPLQGQQVMEEVEVVQALPLPLRKLH